MVLQKVEISENSGEKFTAMWSAYRPAPQAGWISAYHRIESASSYFNVVVVKIVNQIPHRHPSPACLLAGRDVVTLQQKVRGGGTGNH